MRHVQRMTLHEELFHAPADPAGGTLFSRTCPSGNVLTGVRWRTGTVVDGIGIECSPVRADGTLGTGVDVGPMAGGNGGTAGRDHCRGGVIAGQSGATAGVSLASLFFAASRGARRRARIPAPTTTRSTSASAC